MNKFAGLVDLQGDEYSVTIIFPSALKSKRVKELYYDHEGVGRMPEKAKLNDYDGKIIVVSTERLVTLTSNPPMAYGVYIEEVLDACPDFLELALKA